MVVVLVVAAAVVVHITDHQQYEAASNKENKMLEEEEEKRSGMQAQRTRANEQHKQPATTASNHHRTQPQHTSHIACVYNTHQIKSNHIYLFMYTGGGPQRGRSCFGCRRSGSPQSRPASRSGSGCPAGPGGPSRTPTTFWAGRKAARRT